MNATPDHPDNNMLASLALDECAGLEWWFKEEGHDEFSPAILSLKAIRRGLTPFLPAAAPISDGTVNVPREPTDEQWSGLARDIIFWHDMDNSKRTPKSLFAFLDNLGRDIPQWLRDEPELQHLDHAISKGTRAVIIYKAMLSASPQSADTLDAKRYPFADLARAAGKNIPMECNQYTSTPCAWSNTPNTEDKCVVCGREFATWC